MRKLLIVALLFVAVPMCLADTLYVTEYKQASLVLYQAAQTPPLVDQIVSISGSSTRSSAFGASTTIIRVHTDAICSVEIGGTAPVATTSSARMVAGQTEYFVVKPGDKVAVISNN